MKLNKLLPITGLATIVTPLVTSCSNTILLNKKFVLGGEYACLETKPFEIIANKNYKFSINVSKSGVLPARLTNLSFSTVEGRLMRRTHGDIKPKTFSISIDGFNLNEVSREMISEVDKSFCIESMWVPEQYVYTIALHYDDIKEDSKAQFTASFEQDIDVVYAIWFPMNG